MFGMDDDDGPFEGLYEDGHWQWDEEELVFKSDLLQDASYGSPLPTIFGPIEFKDDLDLLEQQRFRKRFQRKPDAEDVITLQDVKDVVLFTAPAKILTPAVINILHLNVTERFIRALILFCQYYLQISDEMSRRSLESKVRTPKSDETESEFRHNLNDLRLLIAKEYCTMLMGCGEFAKYHHMGLSKKMRSLSKRDGTTFETILRICIQIVWLALGRKSLNQIEFEVHRMFKSQIFNIVEHRLNTKLEAKMSSEEHSVLIGDCGHRGKKLTMHSPLLNGLLCKPDIDFRILGLGEIKYPRLTSRLRYLERALVAPEILFAKLEVTLGIMGLARNGFDTILKKINIPPSTSGSTSASSHKSVGRLASRASRMSTGGMRKSTAGVKNQKLYNDIVIPEAAETDYLPDQFHADPFPLSSCNKVQRQKWLVWVSRIAEKNSRRKNKL